MDIWIYRPDLEAKSRKINRDYLYNCKGEAYWDCYDAKKEVKRLQADIEDKMMKKACKSKVEVSYD